MYFKYAHLVDKQAETDYTISNMEKKKMEASHPWSKSGM